MKVRNLEIMNYYSSSKASNMEREAFNEGFRIAVENLSEAISSLGIDMADEQTQLKISNYMRGL